MLKTFTLYLGATATAVALVSGPVQAKTPYLNYVKVRPVGPVWPKPGPGCPMCGVMGFSKGQVSYR